VLSVLCGCVAVILVATFHPLLNATIGLSTTKQEAGVLISG